MLLYCVCVENTNLCYNPKLFLEFRKLWLLFSCLQQHFNYSLKRLLNWRPELHRAAGLEKECNVCTLHCVQFINTLTNKYIYIYIVHLLVCILNSAWCTVLALKPFHLSPNQRNKSSNNPAVIHNLCIWNKFVCVEENGYFFYSHTMKPDCDTEWLVCIKVANSLVFNYLRVLKN